MQSHHTARVTLHRAVALTLVGVVVGGFSAIATIGFTNFVFLLNDWLLPGGGENGLTSGFNPQVMLVLTGGGLVIGLLLRFSEPPGAVLGPQDTLYAVHLRQALPHPRAGALSTLAAAISLGCGASVGQYGPLVYLGSLVGQLLPSLAIQLKDLRNIAIACGVAAAIATAFNAPIAALIFTHELILRHYSMKAFTAVTVASATGYVVSHLVYEHPPLFLIETEYQIHTAEYLLFALEGLACGILSVVFLKLLERTNQLAKAIPIPQFTKPMLAGFLMSLVVMVVPQVLGAGNDVFYLASVDDYFNAEQLLVILVAKIFVTVLCLGFGFAGGVIYPALLVGTLFGALFAITIPANLLAETAGLSAYAIAGMMAVMSPIIGAPMTALLLVFELTHNYDVTIAAMVAIVFSNLVSYQWYGRSLYDRVLMDRGMDLSLGREHAYLMHRKVVDFVDQVLAVQAPSATIDQAAAAMAKSDHDVIVLAAENNRFLGLIYAHQLARLSADTRLDELEYGEALILDEKTSLLHAMEAIRNNPARVIVVIDATTGAYQGSVTTASIVNSFLEATGELRREEYEV